MLGKPEITRITEGGVANLNRFDAADRLSATYLCGRILN
jgi:hypothetical protein